MDSRPAPTSDVEIDFRALTSVLWRRLPYLILFLVIVAAGTWVVLSRVAPVYKSEATLLIATGESISPARRRPPPTPPRSTSRRSPARSS
ncbi:MAG: Wzz/FepE/Etk N-terminal domain-containing protein [Bauldia sp.]